MDQVPLSKGERLTFAQRIVADCKADKSQADVVACLTLHYGTNKREILELVEDFWNLAADPKSSKKLREKLDSLSAAVG